MVPGWVCGFVPVAAYALASAPLVSPMSAPLTDIFDGWGGGDRGVMRCGGQRRRAGSLRRRLGTRGVRADVVGARRWGWVGTGVVRLRVNVDDWHPAPA